MQEYVANLKNLIQSNILTQKRFSFTFYFCLFLWQCSMLGLGVGALQGQHYRDVFAPSSAQGTMRYQDQVQGSIVKDPGLQPCKANAFSISELHYQHQRSFELLGPDDQMEHLRDRNYIFFVNGKLLLFGWMHRIIAHFYMLPLLCNLVSKMFKLQQT